MNKIRGFIRSFIARVQEALHKEEEKLKACQNRSDCLCTAEEWERAMNIFTRLKTKINSFLNFLQEIILNEPAGEPQKQPETVLPEPEIVLPPPPESVRAPEPPHTGKLGKIGSFLWKPKSDTDSFPVVTVSCDDVPAEELFIEILHANLKPIKLQTNKPSFWGIVRGNKLPNMQYGRLNFRLRNKLEELEKLQPLTVRFYQEINGVKTFLPIMSFGKDIVVKDVRKRVDLK